MNKRIVSDPAICGGEPCIAGTRIPASMLLSHLAVGDSYEEVLKQFPRLAIEGLLPSEWVNIESKNEI